jgi:hypothetical protein
VTRDKLESACRRYLPALEPTWNEIFQPEHHHFVDVSTEEPGKVAYSPDGVARDDHKRRRKLAIGRYLSRQCGVEVNAEIDRGINAILAELLGESIETSDEFTVLRGDAITEAYVKVVGSRSCMVGEENREITQWYSLFPDKIGLLVWRQTEGRALLWTLDDGRRALDRVYAGNRDLALPRYRQWAIDNEACSIYERWAGMALEFPFEHVASVTLGCRAVDGRPVPYLDSLCYASDDGVFSSDNSDCRYTCQCTYGGMEDTESEPEYSCGDCGEGFHDCENLHSVNDGDREVCESCLQNYLWCERCEQYHNGEIVDVEGQMWCEGCARISAPECARCENHFRDVNLTDGHCQTCCEETVVCDSCSSHEENDDIVSVQGIHYWCSRCAGIFAATCDGCRDVFPIVGMQTNDGCLYCEDCIPETEAAVV